MQLAIENRFAVWSLLEDLVGEGGSTAHVDDRDVMNNRIRAIQHLPSLCITMGKLWSHNEVIPFLMECLIIDDPALSLCVAELTPKLGLLIFFENPRFLHPICIALLGSSAAEVRSTAIESVILLHFGPFCSDGYVNSIATGSRTSQNHQNKNWIPESDLSQQRLQHVNLEAYLELIELIGDVYGSESSFFSVNKERVLGNWPSFQAAALTLSVAVPALRQYRRNDSASEPVCVDVARKQLALLKIAQRIIRRRLVVLSQPSMHGDVSLARDSAAWGVVDVAAARMIHTLSQVLALRVRENLESESPLDVKLRQKILTLFTDVNVHWSRCLSALCHPITAARIASIPWVAFSGVQLALCAAAEELTFLPVNNMGNLLSSKYLVETDLHSAASYQHSEQTDARATLAASKVDQAGADLPSAHKSPFLYFRPYKVDAQHDKERTEPQQNYFKMMSSFLFAQRENCQKVHASAFVDCLILAATVLSSDASEAPVDWRLRLLTAYRLPIVLRALSRTAVLMQQERANLMKEDALRLCSRIEAAAADILQVGIPALASGELEARVAIANALRNVVSTLLQHVPPAFVLHLGRHMMSNGSQREESDISLSKTVYPVASSLMHDSNPTVRAAVVPCLAELLLLASQWNCKRLGSPGMDKVWGSQENARAHTAKKSYKLLLAALHDEAPAVRLAAIAALGRCVAGLGAERVETDVANAAAALIDPSLDKRYADAHLAPWRVCEGLSSTLLSVLETLCFTSDSETQLMSPLQGTRPESPIHQFELMLKGARDSCGDDEEGFIGRKSGGRITRRGEALVWLITELHYHRVHAVRESTRAALVAFTERYAARIDAGEHPAEDFSLSLHTTHTASFSPKKVMKGRGKHWASIFVAQHLWPSLSNHRSTSRHYLMRMALLHSAIALRVDGRDVLFPLLEKYCCDPIANVRAAVCQIIRNAVSSNLRQNLSYQSSKINQANADNIFSEAVRQKEILPILRQLVEDSESTVREAATLALKECL